MTSAAGTAGTSTKRKYRRHPKVSEVQTRRGHCKKRSNAFEEAHSDSFQPDEHAPERPPSAYVIFSNREYLFELLNMPKLIQSRGEGDTQRTRTFLHGNSQGRGGTVANPASR